MKRHKVVKTSKTRHEQLKQSTAPMTVPTVSQLDYGFQAMSLGIHVAINGTHVSITPASNPSRLLSLPPELRNRIYEYVLTRRHRLLPWKRQNIYPVEPALTRTCRQMRSEALGVFYHDNTFVAPVLETDKQVTVERAIGWYKRIGAANAEFLVNREEFGALERALSEKKMTAVD